MLSLWEIFSHLPLSYFYYESILAIILIQTPLLCFLALRMNIAWQRKAIAFTITAFLVSLFGYAAFFAPKNLVIHTEKITSKNLPTMKIAVVADLHVGPYRRDDWVKKVVEKINAIPDLEAVLIPGDFIYGGTIFTRYLKPLSQLEVPIIFATLGNHDHSDGIDNAAISAAVSKALQDYQVPELKNATAFWSEKNIWIVGVDDNDLGYDDLPKALSDIPKHLKDFPKILLAHSPDMVDHIRSEDHIDLVVSGHTHCGQVRLPWLGAVPFLIPTKNGKNLERHFYDLPHTDLFITCGVGEVGTRMRFLNPPEIAILEIN